MTFKSVSKFLRFVSTRDALQNAKIDDNGIVHIGAGGRQDVISPYRYEIIDVRMPQLIPVQSFLHWICNCFLTTVPQIIIQPGTALQNGTEGP